MTGAPLQTPARVAIVGGGCAAMACAFELTRPEHQGAYQVTVYQMGWRLGGKGASGRGPRGRIEEHGLHLWMGFYENAFRLMRETYAELDRQPGSCPIATWEDAFKPAPAVSVAERVGEDWVPWIAHFPASPGLPGGGLRHDNPFTVRGYLVRALSLVVELLRSAQRDGPPRDPAPPRPFDLLIDALDKAVSYGAVSTLVALTEAVLLAQSTVQALTAAHEADETRLLRLIDAVALASRQILGSVVEGDPSLRRTWTVIDLILAIVRGAIRFGLLMDPRGFDAIDDYDWRAWLSLNGASQASVDSAFVRGIYDLTFAFKEGDPERPSLSAGVALRGAMRMFFTYRSSLFWRMAAGMGDVVFAPLYEVLARRGVRFEFFHRLDTVEISEAAPGELPHVTALQFAVQAEVRSGPYQPLVPIHGLPCWPSEPDYAQLVDGAKIEEEGWELESPWESRVAGTTTRRVGDDFDLVVLGTGLDALKEPCRALVERCEAWREMFDHLGTTATQALQLWLTEDMAQLGWPHGPINLSAWVEPFDTWADMTHLIPSEEDPKVRTIAYFCSPYPMGPVTPNEAWVASRHAAVRGNAIGLLDRDVGSLWPDAVGPDGRFRWGVLTPPPTQGNHPIDTQFWTANVRPSDRYSLSLPGTQRFRISPLDLHFDNLTLAGDWTATGLDSGCVESAVISGMLAAHALSGRPHLTHIVGYDHP